MVTRTSSGEHLDLERMEGGRMEELTKTARAEELIQRMRSERGGQIYPEWEYAARADPEFVERYAALTSHLLTSRGRALDAKVRELVFVAVVAKVGDAQGLRAHMRSARREGATWREMLEVLETVLPPAGVPAFLFGVRILIELEQEDPDHDSPVRPGKEQAR